MNSKDPYINKNGVLISKLGNFNYDELRQAEADIGFIKLINIDALEIKKFDADLLKKIHKHIFEDIYEWAGEYRTVPLVKEEIVLPGYSLPYTEPKNIKKELINKLNELNKIAWYEKDIKEISFLFARKLARIWLIHPFRDGNTRTFISFAYLYAKEHNFPFDIQTFIDQLNRKYNEKGNIISYSVRDKFALASLDDAHYPEPEHLAKIFEKAILNYQNNSSKKRK